MSDAPARPASAPPPDTASPRTSASGPDTGADLDTGETTCPHCGESRDLAKVKGCIKCLRCGFKFDCNGW